MAGIRIAGMAKYDHAATIDAFQTLVIDPATRVEVVEVGISHNGAANDTNTPGLYGIIRTTTAGTGTGGTVVNMHDGLVAPASTVDENMTANGTGADVAHSWYVPTVSGMIWVAAPGREIDCIAAEWIGINVITAPSVVANTTYIVWEE
jgi:hypothetical protein